MISLPEWVPNVHPLIIHFPIALVFVAVFFDFVALMIKKRRGFGLVADSLFVLGFLGALVALLTGRAAADGILLPSAAQTVLTDHANWATITVWFFGLFALLRVVLLVLSRAPGIWARAAIFLLGAGGLFLVAQTADYGAKMVYKYGVGVQAVPTEGLVPHDHDTGHESDVDTGHSGADDHYE